MKYLLLLPIIIVCSCIKRDANTYIGVRGANYVTTKGASSPKPVIEKTILRLINNGNKCSFVMGKSFSNYFEVSPNSENDVEMQAGNFEYNTICSFSSNCNNGSGSSNYKVINIINNSITELDVSCY
jgi:hypothetical protein